MDVPEDIQRGYQLAKEALSLAYAPYSKYQVGCALKAYDDDRIYTGCNVENVVLPAGICAERSAIASLFGRRNPSRIKIQWLIVVTDSELGDVPCGLCQQVIAEFAEPDLPIYIGNLQELKCRHDLRELRPLNYEFPHREDKRP